VKQEENSWPTPRATRRETAFKLHQKSK